MDTKICACCKRELPVDNFYGSKHSPDGLDSYCKECRRAKSKKSYATNRHKIITTGGGRAHADQNMDYRPTDRKGITNACFDGVTSRALLEELQARGYKWAPNAIYIEKVRTDRYYVKL